MKKITIAIPAHPISYPIIIGTDLLSRLNEIVDVSTYSTIAIITDEVVAKHFLPLLKQGIGRSVAEIILPTGEQTKHIETVKTIWSQLFEAGCDRKSLVINLGGGVIGDMGGFAASTYMRGIKFLQIPTTLLAQVDASVGGKVGINFGETKNIIGSFQQPISVIIDVNTLKTLPQRELFSGFAEIIKHGLIDDPAYFEKVTSKPPLSFSQDELIEIVEGSCRIKAHLVQADEKESGARMLLNFGHTVGHAIEAHNLHTNHPLLHGEAISIGMVAEAKISQLIGMIEEEEVKQVEKALQQARLPIRLSNVDIETLMPFMHKDKKNIAGKIKWTLLAGIGKADFNIQVNEKFIKKALQYVMT